MSASARTTRPPEGAEDKSKLFFDTGEYYVEVKSPPNTYFKKGICKIEPQKDPNKVTFSFHLADQNHETPLNIEVAISYREWLVDEGPDNSEHAGYFAAIRDPREKHKELEVGTSRDLAVDAINGGNVFNALDGALQLLAIEAMRKWPSLPIFKAAENSKVSEMLSYAMEIVYLRRLALEKELRNTRRGP